MKFFSIFIVFVSMWACTGNQKKLTYHDVVSRMIDLKRLAELPVEGEKGGMFSSYDRRSAYDTLSGKYNNWSANDDGLTPQYIRKEGENMALNGRELKKKLSFRYDNPLPATEYVFLGTVDVPDGKQNLTLKWIESDSNGKRMELDYLKFEP